MSDQLAISDDCADWTNPSPGHLGRKHGQGKHESDAMIGKLLIEVFESVPHKKYKNQGGSMATGHFFAYWRIYISAGKSFKFCC